MSKKKLLFVGDLFYDYDYIADDIEELSKWIKENNLVTIVNLEGAIKYNGGKPIAKRGPNLASDETVIDVLKKLNTAGVCLANNHTMDFDAAALKNTISLLDKNGIKHCGAGKNLSEALEPMVLNINGEKLSFLNFGWDIEETVYADEQSAGCAPRNEDIILKNIKNASKNCERVFVCLHWGFEYNRLPMPYDIALAHKMIDSGAELIIGHHPHCVQPFEIYKEKPIYYSLGNFYFAGRRQRFKKEFSDSITNQSDYGAMIVYDISEHSTENYLIKYDRASQKSVILPCKDDSVLEDISTVEYTSPDYVKRVKDRKLNINPVLTTDDKYNEKELKKLFLKYDIKRKIKKILGRG